MNHSILVAASQAASMPVPEGLWVSREPIPSQLLALMSFPGFWKGAADVRREQAEMGYASGNPHSGDFHSRVAHLYDRNAILAADHAAEVRAASRMMIQLEAEEETIRDERRALDMGLVDEGGPFSPHVIEYASARLGRG